MVDFAALKRKNSLDNLTNAVKALTTNSYSNDDDEKYWQPTVDKAGNGSATIRFLPAPDGEDVPFVRLWSHGFQGVGGWLIENCPTTLGYEHKCPVCEYNGVLYNSGIEDDKKQVSKQKRHLHYIANVYIIKDPGNPENEGKVKLFKFGSKIFDKLNDAMHPVDEDDVAMNPFDMWGGANFKLRIRKVEGYRNYDKSSFDSPSALMDDDSDLEVIYKSEFPLLPIVASDQFKSHADIKSRLDKVLGLASTKPTSRATVEDDDDDEPITKPVVKSRVKAEPKKPTVEEDDDLSFFNNLANELDDEIPF